MRILQVRNVQEALPRAISLLESIGVARESRNGPVLYGGSVTTIYSKPLERVIFWPERDANPFFHLYESLWMLMGRDDVAPLVRYVKNSANYSDDGIVFHGAYGYRWRKAFLHDQLQIIAERLTNDKDDRRCILQMWDTRHDLGFNSKDLPCNVMATFQRDKNGALDLTVFCRSNDIIWGAYGANAVQFATLLEYMALWIGCPVGIYTQISINWHGYLDTLEKVKNIRPDRVGYVYNPYIDDNIHYIPMNQNLTGIHQLINIHQKIQYILYDADTGFSKNDSSIGMDGPDPIKDPWARMVYLVLKAHHLYKTNTEEAKFSIPLALLNTGDPKADWIVAAKQWIERRRYIWGTTQLFNGKLSHP